MKQKIKVLLLTEEAWNDSVFGNNNMTNWFDGMDGIELAAMYCSEGQPKNSCCKKYFQVTNSMVLKAVFSEKRAGVILEEKDYSTEPSVSDKINMDSSLISRITSTHKDSFRLIRDILWIHGRYDKKALKEFVDGFNPDMIFVMWRASVKMCKALSLLKECTNAPIAVFTGDNELDYGVPVLSPFAITRRLMIRHTFGKMAPTFAKYYTSSEEQSKRYAKDYGIETELIFKCGKADESRVHNELHNPIRFLYVGRLYCGRWKTLANIGNILKIINKDEVRAMLDIYSMDNLSKKQIKALDDKRNIFLRGPIAPDKIKDEYEKSDIVLHVESFDIKNRAVTRYSYSTKVVDCLGSGCAVMAIGWEKHSACVELKKDESAIVVTDINDLKHIISDILDNPEIILTYAKKAMDSIEKKHSREVIQNQLYSDFCKITESYKK